MLGTKKDLDGNKDPDKKIRIWSSRYGLSPFSSKLPRAEHFLAHPMTADGPLLITGIRYSQVPVVRRKGHVLGMD